jgi:hypothetical protein
MFRGVAAEDVSTRVNLKLLFARTFLPGASTLPRAEAVMFVIFMFSRTTTAWLLPIAVAALCNMSLRTFATHPAL